MANISVIAYIELIVREVRTLFSELNECPAGTTKKAQSLIRLGFFCESFFTRLRISKF